MFALESDMTASVERWMKRAGLHVKAEFISPYGYCDLVGVQFDQKRMNHRLRLNQMKPVGSIIRSELLLQIPDVETKQSISFKQLASKYASFMDRDTLKLEVERLIADRFVIRITNGNFQKVNGWMPLQKRIIAVELKLARIKEAMSQASGNLDFADESFVAFPLDVAKRIVKNRHRWADCFDEGVGLIGVSPHRCSVLIPSIRLASEPDPALKFHAVEKFWRSRPWIKGN